MHVFMCQLGQVRHIFLKFTSMNECIVLFSIDLLCPGNMSLLQRSYWGKESFDSISVYTNMTPAGLSTLYTNMTPAGLSLTLYNMTPASPWQHHSSFIQSKMC